MNRILGYGVPWSSQPLRGKPQPALVWLVVALWSALATTATAVPYASGVTNSGGTVSFILNESATDVTVALSGGPGGTTNFGARTKGIHTFALDGNTAFSIQVSNNAPSGWTVSSDDLNPLVRFYSPRGVAVNCNPTNLTNFGRIYVSTATTGTTKADPTNSSRFTGRGIYILNADQTDTFGQGTNARTAGIVFDTSGPHRVYYAHNSPWRIGLGPDGCLYVCDYSIETGTLYRTDPDVTTNLMVLQGQGRDANPLVHTTISSVYVEGSLEHSNLVVYANDGGWAAVNPKVTNGFIGLVRWPIGAGPLPWNTPPDRLAPADYTALAQRIYDLDRGPDGKFYISVYREYADIPALSIFDSSGLEELWNLDPQYGSESKVGPVQLRGIKLSVDGSLLALVRHNYWRDLWLLPLTNGIPDLPRLRLLNVFGGQRLPPTDACMDAAFDAAGNLYAVSAGPEKLRILSPGGQTVAITTFDGAKGSFTLSRQESAPDLLLTATTNTISEAGPPAAFTITRLGSTTEPLTVFYEMSGTASNGMDYTNLGGSVVLSAGVLSTNVFLSPVDDTLSEETETVTMILTSSGSTNNSLGLGAPRCAIAVLDNDTPDIAIVGVRTNIYEGDTNVLATIAVTRRGDLEEPASLILDWLGGTAVPNQDYVRLDPPKWLYEYAPKEIAGVALPLDDTQIEGAEEFLFRLWPDPWGRYTVGTNIVTGVIRDHLADGPPLFAENFEDPTVVTNWNVKFAVRSGVSDYSLGFGCLYGKGSTDPWHRLWSIPPAPHSTGTAWQDHGLFLEVNDSETNVLGGAGLNLYPVGQNFTGDFALRFDMYLYDPGDGPTTEHAIFGINHSGSKTNWFRFDTDGAVGAVYDGLWFQLSADGAGYGDYVLNTGPAVVANGMTSPTVLASRSAWSLSDLLLSPYKAGTVSDRWVDVEVRQAGNLVTLRINNAIILSVTNPTPYTGGNIMLGYDDPFDSWGGGFVLYDNVRVYRLTANVVPVAAALLGESCSPPNAAVDPGETVAINFTLQNVGLANTTNLVATLQTSGGVTSASAPQTYGALTPGGAPVTRSFTFSASGTCGGTVAATLQLQDGGTDLGTAVFNLPLGQLAFTTNFAEAFDGVAAPALPAGWSSSISGPGTVWRTLDWDYDTPPNAAYCDVDGTGDNRLVSPSFVVSPPSQLTFRQAHNWYNYRYNYIGGVLEVSINGSAFEDIVTAGGLFLTNGYNGFVVGYDNPLAGRNGWVGQSGGYITTTVILPPSPPGSAMQLRWRLGSGIGEYGYWLLDTISVLDGSYTCCSPVTRPAILYPSVQDTNLLFSFQSVLNQGYQVEYKDDLTKGTWTLLQLITGDGSLLTITNALTSPTQGFFRLRMP